MLLYLLFMLPPLIFMIWAQSRVSSAYNKYSKVRNMSGLTGAQAAQTLLEYNGLREVRIEGAKGRLTDHYDPRHKVLRLSADVARLPSVAALGIVAHEVGHAAQDKLGYAPMRIRSALVPAANLGSRFGFICVILGLILFAFNVAFGETLAWVGVWLFAAAVLFALVTLPVEYNASNRARQMLQATGLVSAKEYQGASTVLSAAALTYVAALLQAVAQLFFFLFLVLGMRR
ncbi:MAG: zinc metallopeptidase [Dehalococcoidia bacterium]|nr:zinc metallopeptidase [Dehalococcoidia bacterium]